MNIGVLGTGEVGRAVGTRLAAAGHDVMMGSRQADNPTAVEWARHAPNARAGTFADAAAHGALVINATAGTATLEVLRAAGAAHLHNKVLIDASNPLDASNGTPTLTVSNTDSLAEQIQREFPAAQVVKTLNTVNAQVMVNPASVPGDHVLFVAGEDMDAKNVAIGLLGEMGWPEERILDLGGISAARGMEAYVLLWVSIMGVTGGSAFNVTIARA
jgi:predicted dinucleotide-binding enzyme